MCGAANACAMVAAAQPATGQSVSSPSSAQVALDCWCQRVAVSANALAQIPADKVGLACLCPRCAQRAAHTPCAETGQQA
nr:cysteine-rich CWC family protein [Curvibacter sp. CHRR-16]